jgi:predicted AAA+ superfamily ATPase
MITYRTLDIDGLWNKLDTYDIDPDKLVPRVQLKKITQRFQTDHVELITGPRQSGKTTLLMMLIHELDKQGIPPRKIFYLNLDTIDQVEQFKNPMLLVDRVDYFRERGERVYLFLDEAQRLEAPGKFLKGLYDLNKKIKVFASGSSTLELRSKIKEFLTGRKRETYLYPLSFKELILGENKIPPALFDLKLDQASTAEWQQKEKLFGPYLTRIMEDMLIYGGYPAVLTASDHEKRKEELEEIYISYVKKDIIDFLKVERTDVFNHLVKVLASQVGNLVNKSEICSLLGSNAVTITRYMNILQETYIAAYLPPFVSSRRNEIKSTHKCFFLDNGLRNFALRQFNPVTLRTDQGALLENLVFTELVKDNVLQKEELFFWRSKNGAEVDFVMQGKGGIVPLEIKAGTARPGLLSRSFHAFLDHFSPGAAVFLNRDLFHVERIKQTNVYYVPAHWFLLFGLELLDF